MGRSTKIYPEQVLAFLKEKKRPIPTREIAAEFGCTRETINRKARILRQDREPILPTQDGLFYCPHVENEKQAIPISNSGIWQTRIIMALAEIARVTMKPLREARKELMAHLTVEDRKELRQAILVMKNTIDLLDLDDEESEPRRLSM